MGIYQTRLLPWLIDLVMRRRELLIYRQEALSEARGDVLEIGVGSGLNLPIYGKGVIRFCGLDPSAELLGLARDRARDLPFSALLVRASAEALPIADRSIDAVVTTWTLCSIPDVTRALREARRVLRADGRLFFVEHGLAPESRIERWQHVLTPLWRRVAGGCHLDRNMAQLIRAAGFEIEALSSGYMPGPKIMTYFYQGRARLA
jgi:ubiquinone/menaquinone biosynthesis C-methylase UbiE